jgi:hypothetical protein
MSVPIAESSIDRCNLQVDFAFEQLEGRRFEALKISFQNCEKTHDAP